MFYDRVMSERSIHLRDQAERCRSHARAIDDPQTQTELHKLADEYLEQAAVIESKSKAASGP